MPVRLVGVLLALVLGAAAAGCGDAASDRASRGSAPSEPAGVADDGIDVPDVSGEDGAATQSDVEAAGLTATFADPNDDPGSHTTRDGSGCEVTDKDPLAGEMAADGDEVEVTIDCAQVDWENQEGPAWEAFRDAYSSAFDGRRSRTRGTRRLPGALQRPGPELAQLGRRLDYQRRLPDH